MSEGTTVSEHMVRVVACLRGNPSTWFHSDQIAESAKVAKRTARAHATRLVALGMLDVAEVFPGRRYRWSEKAEKRNAAWLRRVEQAAEVLGVERK